MPCDFFLYRYVMDYTFLLSLPLGIPVLQRIIPTISEIELYMQQRIWVETDYRLDICHITEGQFLEHLEGMQRKITWKVSLLICSLILQSISPYKRTDFTKRVRELRITPYLCPQLHKYLQHTKNKPA
jgi:hypothetical protein